MAKYPKEERIPPSLKPKKAIELLRKQKEKIDELMKLHHNDPEVDKWENFTKQIIIKAFGDPHENLSTFWGAGIGHFAATSYSEMQENFMEGLHKRKKLLEGFIEQLEAFGEVTPESAGMELRGNKIFFAYATKRKDLVLNLARYVEKQHGLKTVLMEEEPHGGRSLIEKFEELASECGFGVFVLTADDECIVSTPNGEKKEKRARQNVILEVGYFWGMLGRKKRIAVLVEEGVEIPTDVNALGWIPITGDLGDTKLKLTQELEKAEIVRST
ncbi:MAG: nucleotide-binding protein [Planctomycetes bacterium]|nr:nucleotide-binding protein [Planctomycetota bacterium]